MSDDDDLPVRDADVAAAELKRRRAAEAKAAKANARADFYQRMLEREVEAHRCDVAHIFNRILANELEGRPVPAREMPNILDLTIEEEKNEMYWEPDAKGVEKWIERRMAK